MMIQKTKVKVAISAFLLCIILTGCFKNFYTVKTYTGYDSLKNVLRQDERRVIVHYEKETAVLNDLNIESDQMAGTLTPYYPAKPSYEEPATDRKLNNYKSKHRSEVFGDIHVYSSAQLPGSNNQAYVIRKEDLIKYNIYTPNEGASIGSHVLGFIIIAGIITAIAIGVGNMSIPMGFGG
jgi:hypothetical protein